MATVTGVLVSVLFIIICVLLILVVLLQKGRGGGLGAALGGAGTAAFGTKVGDFMTWVTIVLTSLFILLAISVALMFRPPRTKATDPKLLPNPAIAISEDKHVSIEVEDTEGDKVWYTTDGTTPSKRNGDQYVNAFLVSPGTVVKAIAYPQRGDPSNVVEAHYRAPQPLRPLIKPMPNLQNPITTPTEVTIEAGNKTDRVFYTTNRSEPTEDSRLYSAPITVTPGMTLRIRAFAPHAPPSEIVEFTYGVKGISPPPITTQPGVTPATRPAVGVGQ